MALIQCPECKREVSSAAEACPQCGHPIARRVAAPPPQSEMSPWIKWPLGTLLGLLLLSMIWPPINRSLNPPKPGGPADKGAAQATRQCDVSKWTWNQSGNWLTVEGIVSNPAAFSRIHLQVEDGRGALIGTETAYLKPGGVWSGMLRSESRPDAVEIVFACD